MAYRRINENEATRDILVRCASDLLQKKGSDFSIREVCAAAGVSVGTFYTYYKNKSELILERLGMRDQMLITALADERSDDPIERLYFLGDFCARYNLDRGVLSCRDVYKNMQSSLISIEEDHKTVLFLAICEAIREGQRSGLFSEAVNAEEVADNMLAIIRGCGFNWCYYDGEGYDLRKQIRNGVGAVIKGLLAR